MAGLKVRYTVLAGLLLVGLVLRLLVAEWRARGFPEGQLPDQQLYEAYAQTIWQSESYFVGNDGAKRAPGYPLFIAGCWALGGYSARAVLWGQALVATVTCWLTYRLTKNLTQGSISSEVRERAALVALALAVFDPYALGLVGLMLSETLFACLLLACMVWQTESGPATFFLSSIPQINKKMNEQPNITNPARILRGWRLMPGIVWGMIAGGAVLVRPSGLPALLALGVWGGWNIPRRTWWYAGVFWGVLVTLAPWWLRNAWVYKTFVPTTLNVGESLYDGWNPRAHGGSEMWFDSDPQARALPELERDRYWRHQALVWAAANPGQVCYLAGVKLLRFWSPWPNGTDFRHPLVVLATLLATAVLALPLVIGSRAAAPSICWLCWTPVLAFCVLHLVFVSSVRYRVPGMPPLFALAGIGAARWWMTQPAAPATDLP